MKKPLMDRHPADINTALKKKSITLTAQSRMDGLSSSTLANALVRPWPRGEKIITDVLGVSPEVIWPTRYYDNSGNRVERTLRKK